MMSTPPRLRSTYHTGHRWTTEQSNPRYGDKYRVALELYTAQLNERQVRVRFILLIIAMEALAKPSKKHPVARKLLARWHQELDTEKSKYDAASEEYKSLNALSDEFDFRSRDSIKEQIRKLFADVPGVGDEERRPAGPSLGRLHEAEHARP